jgi:hypothetical protein
MAQPRRDPDPGPETGGRPLADILREAGIEAPRSARRRRGDTGDIPVKQRQREPDTDTDTGPNPGRRASDTGRVAREAVRPAREVSRDTGRVTAEKTGRGPDGPTTAAIPGIRPTRKPGVPGADPAPATGPIPVTRARETDVLDEPLGAREGALAWLRFAGELVLALAAGVGIYFLSTVVWEQVPQVAVVLAPLAVTGLVAGVAAWRRRTGREPVGPVLIAVLVFAGTLLTIAPAAGLLAAT